MSFCIVEFHFGEMLSMQARSWMLGFSHRLNIFVPFSFLLVC